MNDSAMTKRRRHDHAFHYLDTELLGRSSYESTPNR
jgi:hypothetical protein